MTNFAYSGMASKQEVRSSSTAHASMKRSLLFDMSRSLIGCLHFVYLAWIGSFVLCRVYDDVYDVRMTRDKAV